MFNLTFYLNMNLCSSLCYCQLSIINASVTCHTPTCILSVVTYLLDIVNLPCLLSIVSCQFSLGYCQLAIVTCNFYCQYPFEFCHLKFAYCHLSIVALFYCHLSIATCLLSLKYSRISIIGCLPMVTWHFDSSRLYIVCSPLLLSIVNSHLPVAVSCQ